MKSKITLFPKNILLICLMLVTSGLFAQSGCEAEIGVEKNRKVKSASTTEGAYFIIILTNTGNSTDSFDLTIEDVNGGCSNIDGSTNATNVVLNYSFLDLNKNSITNVSLDAGESYKFLAYVTVPNGIALGSWSCAQINATSTNCSNYSVSSMLHTRIVNSDDD